MRILQPKDWAQPKGYANGTMAAGRMVFVAGQIGWDAQQVFHAHDLAGQFEQVLHNTLAILAEAGARPQHIARMTWYVTDIEAYRRAAPELGAIYRKLIGRHYPAMAVLEVAGLVEREALIEIETTAVIP
ncbi:MAG: RidA family protein [Pseudomonadota bacterium]